MSKEIKTPIIMKISLENANRILSVSLELKIEFKLKYGIKTKL